jgi:hypothetical protein
MTKTVQDMCPICCEPFQAGEAIIDYQTWGDSTKKGHVDCIFSLSKAENRKHPPRQN